MKRTIQTSIIIFLISLLSINVNGQKAAYHHDHDGIKGSDPIMQVNNLTKKQKDKIMSLREKHNVEMKKYREKLLAHREKIKDIKNSENYKLEDLQKEREKTIALKKKMVKKREKHEKQVYNVLTKEQQKQVDNIRSSYEKNTDCPYLKRKSCCSKDKASCKDKKKDCKDNKKGCCKDKKKDCDSKKKSCDSKKKGCDSKKKGCDSKKKSCDSKKKGCSSKKACKK